MRATRRRYSKSRRRSLGKKSLNHRRRNTNGRRRRSRGRSRRRRSHRGGSSIAVTKSKKERLEANKIVVSSHEHPDISFYLGKTVVKIRGTYYILQPVKWLDNDQPYIPLRKAPVDQPWDWEDITFYLGEAIFAIVGTYYILETAEWFANAQPYIPLRRKS